MSIKFGKQKSKQTTFNSYSPKLMTSNDMEEGLRELFAKTKKTEPQQYQTPRSRTPQKPIEYPPQPQPTEPYWSGEAWEEWALALYDSQPKLRPILPEWFLEAIEA